ncbi:hypothetical protein BC355_09140 [Vibrio cholerae]|uniref:Uncharacterized protein n=1 Tax=Vibrio cholerae TaxID=666 RepID=A0A395U2J6_VIBCL|nr:hypothetical protein BC353_09950 [Vibrio cholerae]RGP90058.1 hypothetical protein BC355_09140 [Vibrio cholerae]RGP90782.1 hypothetical protein BC354_08340 [Vibrio cholerae]
MLTWLIQPTGHQVAYVMRLEFLIIPAQIVVGINVHQLAVTTIFKTVIQPFNHLNSGEETYGKVIFLIGEVIRAAEQ